MLSFQSRNNVKITEMLYSDNFQNILYNAKDGVEVMNLIKEHIDIEVHPICWIYNTAESYEDFKKMNNHLFDNTHTRYWFFENVEKKFDIEKIEFYDYVVEKTVKPIEITDMKRREILGLPTPSQTETEHKLVYCFVPYMEQKQVERFFKYPLFRRSVMKMNVDQVTELVTLLGIKNHIVNILYFNSHDELTLELNDFGSYGASNHYWWTKDRQRK